MCCCAGGRSPAQNGTAGREWLHIGRPRPRAAVGVPLCCAAAAVAVGGPLEGGARPLIGGSSTALRGGPPGGGMGPVLPTTAGRWTPAAGDTAAAAAQTRVNTPASRAGKEVGKEVTQRSIQLPLRGLGLSRWWCRCRRWCLLGPTESTGAWRPASSGWRRWAAGLGRSHRCAAAGPDRRPARRPVDAAGAAGEQL